MVEWQNWSGRVRGTPARVPCVRDEAEIAALLRGDPAVSLRVVGSAHSHASLVPTAGWILDLSALQGVIAVDAAAGTARIRAGSKLSSLGPPLREAGVALLNQGDIDRQSLAGALATGTHGTGRELQNLSASVVGQRLVLADGEIVECCAENEPELLQASRLSLGAFGVVTELCLRVRPAYRLRERMWLQELDSVLDEIDALSRATRHFEFFWLPGKERAACKALAETDEAPVYPLAVEGQRLAWSDEVLANDRPDKHTEMEYSVPIERGPACFRALRALLARDFSDLTWPLEYRTLAADDVWLSTAYQRDTATISVHQGIENDDRALFRACEEIFLEHEGRPHWGKVHFLSAAQLAERHPAWEAWWRVRDQWDPEGRFLNDLLQSWRS